MNFGNLSLLLTGIVTAAIGILGFSVFLNNRKGVTNKSFYTFSLLTIAYIVFNYLARAVIGQPIVSLILFRVTIAVAVWHAFCIFQLLYVFPNETVKFPRWYKWGLVPAVAVVSILNLTRWVFANVGDVSSTGQVITIVNGPGIAVFGIFVLALITTGLGILFRKTLRAEAIQKTQFMYVLVGTCATFILLVVFNFILPAFFNDSNFIALGPLFFFPFITLTFYAITRHGLLSVKVISTEILVFVLSVLTLLELVISQTLAEILLRTGLFALVLMFSFFLIQSVQREVEQRQELERLNKEIQAQKDQLEQLSHFKSELLSLASHQIRSPLAAMKGFVSLIIQGLYGPIGDGVKETLGKVQRSADDLIGLINTLLDVRKVEEGKMEYQFEKIDLVEMVRGIVASIMPLAEVKQLALSFECQAEQVFVSADKEKFRQIIQNLVDNAIKYTPNGFVKVTLTDEGAAATIAVADSGLGIPADLIPYLFEEFVRDERVKKEIRGTGLGLYIARKITEAHGGKIRAESAGEGKGSTFSVTLPKVAM